jgi:mannose-6-phosphate isomerase-like protein (cupin superfamily)
MSQSIAVKSSQEIWWRVAAVAAVTLGLAGLSWTAQIADRWWRPELDATVAAPGNHKILFENDDVRVLEVTVAPGTQEPMHVHRHSAVIYVDSSPQMIEHFQDGTSKDLGVRPAGVRWLPVSQGHAMENVGSEPLHAIRVELKKAQ